MGWQRLEQTTTTLPAARRLICPLDKDSPIFDLKLAKNENEEQQESTSAIAKVIDNNYHDDHRYEREHKVDIKRDGRFIKIENIPDTEVPFDPENLETTFDNLWLRVLDKERIFLKDSGLWEVAKQDLTRQLDQIYQEYHNNDDDEPIRHLISERPKKWVELRTGYNGEETGKLRPVRRIQEVKEVQEPNPKTNQMETKKCYSDIILDAVPAYDGKGIEIVKDPLFGSTKYRIQFEYVERDSDDVIKTTEVIGPKTITELRDYLENETYFVINGKFLGDRLNAIISACVNRSRVLFKEEIEPQGFFLLNDRVVSSKLNLKEPTPESAKAAVNAILEMQKTFFTSSRDKTRLAHYIKLFTVAPFDYVRKQKKGLVQLYSWIPRGDLCGQTGAGKTEYGRLACYMWRLDEKDYVLAKRRYDSEARLIHTLRGTTMPLTFEEGDFLTHYDKHGNTEGMLSVLKNTVDRLDGYRLTQNWQKIPEHYLAYFIITHNSSPIKEDGTSRRFITDYYTPTDRKDTKQNEKQVRQYTEFIADNLDNLGAIGDFVGNYVMNVNPDVLNNDWVTTSKQLLRELFKFAGKPEEEFPKWLDRLITEGSNGEFSDTDLEEDRRELVRSALLRYINDTWTKQRYEYEKFEGVPESVASLAMQVQWLVQTNKLSGFIHHKQLGVCMTSAVIHVLKSYGLASDERITHKMLAHLCDFGEDFKKFNSKCTRVVYADIEKFINFIAPSPDSEKNNNNNYKKKKKEALVSATNL